MEEMQFPTLPIAEEIGIQAEKRAKELGIEFIIPTVYSLGIGCRGSVVPVTAFRSTVCNGVNIHGFMDFAYGGETAECYAIPDVSTLVALPWKKGYGWVACNLYYHGKISPRCPRYNLIKQRDRLKKAGYHLKTGIEPEFFVLKQGELEPSSKLEGPGNRYHDPLLEMDNAEFIAKVLRSMQELGWKPYQMEREGGYGQYEVNFGYDDVLVTADRFSLCKMMLKDIARECGIRVSFIPFLKYDNEMVLGNGQHIHMSLWDAKTDKSVMTGNSEIGFSDVGGFWLAGILNHLDGLTPIVNPTTNSYKRLHGFKNFLNFHAYGINTDFPPLRIVQTNGVCDRIEYRQPDGSINPYLAQAAIIAAGLDGLEKKEEPNPKLRNEEMLFMESTPKDSKLMATSLDLALLNLQADTTLLSAFGEELITAFCTVKFLESEPHNKEVTQAEKNLADVY